MLWINRRGRNRFGNRNLWWPNMRMRGRWPGFRWDMDHLLGGTAGPLQADFPAINVWAGDEGLVVTAEIPGLLPEDIEINVNGNRLTISGERAIDEVPEGARYNRRERSYGKFSRTLKLQYEVDADNVVATFENGILKVELPRLPEEKPRKIEITAASAE